MSTFIGIGFSNELDPVQAAFRAAEQAKLNLHSSTIDFAIVLNTAHYNPSEFIPQLNIYLKKPRMIGSSTAGIILSERVELRGIAVLLMYSDDIRFELGAVENLNLQDLKAAGLQLATNCLLDYGREHRKLFLFFADGLLQEMSRFNEGLASCFQGIIPVVGAGSCDDFTFNKTYQYYNGTILTAGVCGVLWGGRMQAGLSGRHGWRPLGKPRVINSCEGNVIKEIDHKPAANIYAEYFASVSESLRASSLNHLNTRYPLGIPLGRGREYLLRNALKTLEDDSIIVQDTIVEGKHIHLMIGNKESCLQAAETAAREVKAQMLGRPPKFIFIVESLSRYRILGRAAHTEIKRIRSILGPDVPVFGLYSFGETFTVHAPHGPEILLQNESIVITAIS